MLLLRLLFKIKYKLIKLTLGHFLIIHRFCFVLMSFDASARSSEGQNVMVKDSRKSDKSFVCSTAHVSTNVWLAGGAILILGCRSQSHSKAGPLSLPHLSIFFVKRVVDSHRWEVSGSA